MAQTANPWAPQVQGAIGDTQSLVNRGADALGGVNPWQQKAESQYTRGAQYDPAELQRYLNPYTQDAAQATVSQINRNLNENVLPGVNSTFAGQGQFGSSRNADFTNRAVRDNQEAVAKALAQANYGAYNAAQGHYADWADKNLQAGQGLANLGGQQVNVGQAYGNLAGSRGQTAQGLAGAGSTMDQQQLSNLMDTGNAMQRLQQTEYDNVYKDWMNQQSYPMTAMGGLGSIMGSMAQGVRPDTLTSSVGAQQMPTDYARYAGVLGQLGNVANDPAIKNALSDIFSGWN
jgi:hypothetical protein